MITTISETIEESTEEIELWQAPTLIEGLSRLRLF